MESLKVINLFTSNFKKMEIKRFIFKMTVFIVILFPILTFKGFFLYYTGLYQASVNGAEVYWSLQKSKLKKKVKKLLIGDSVGNLLYNNKKYNDSIYSLTCNQAVSMVGHYILLSNFIDTDAENLPKEVIVFMTPDSFSNNLDQEFTYHYFFETFLY